MSSAKKSITKPKTTAPSLITLCTDTLWKESIKGGGADDLVAALQACAKGRDALRKIAPKPIECIGINRACTDGINEGFSAYLRRNSATEILFALLNHHDAGNAFDALHHTGGDNISWESSDELVDWVRACVQAMELDEARAFFIHEMQIRIPKKDEDREPVTCAIEWLEGGDDNSDPDWIDKVVEKADNLLTETEYDTEQQERPNLISAEEMLSYNNQGIPMKPHAVFTINTDGW